MNPDTAFFVTVLALQFVFTAATVLLVGRRYPRRLPAYRLLAPAAVPVLFFLFAAYSFVRMAQLAGLPHLPAAPLVRLLLAYLVLWLIGVVWAGMLIRLVLRPRR